MSLKLTKSRKSNEPCSPIHIRDEFGSNPHSNLNYDNFNWHITGYGKAMVGIVVDGCSVSFEGVVCLFLSGPGSDNRVSITALITPA